MKLLSNPGWRHDKRALSSSYRNLRGSFTLNPFRARQQHRVTPGSSSNLLPAGAQLPCADVSRTESVAGWSLATTSVQDCRAGISAERQHCEVGEVKDRCCTVQDLIEQQGFILRLRLNHQIRFQHWQHAGAAAAPVENCLGVDTLTCTAH